jgi:hypothetical protein
MGHALTFRYQAGVGDREGANIKECELDLQRRGDSLDEIFTLLCGEHGRAIDAGRRSRGIEAQL